LIRVLMGCSQRRVMLGSSSTLAPIARSPYLPC
jgi:hypothetical protein